MKKFSRHVFGSTKQENSGAQTERSLGFYPICLLVTYKSPASGTNGCPFRIHSLCESKGV
ncbi:hypothetical protein [Porphyromonas gulae]|uniref:hypothetical protein n=1 Tax=Porphyromonas gulae TaxID=111105 RepID=UPI001F38D4FE|nr:hypothetical protein [Porphyromonas gulae]